MNCFPNDFGLNGLVGAAFFMILKGRMPQGALSMEHNLEGLVMGAK